MAWVPLEWTRVVYPVVGLCDFLVVDSEFLQERLQNYSGEGLGEGLPVEAGLTSLPLG